MALSFRFVWALLSACFGREIAVGSVLQRQFRLWPFIDCEFGRSLNAAQYLRLSEIVQQEYNTRCGFTFKGFKAGLWAITLSNTIYYRRPLRAFQKVRITVELAGWDDKYWVWESKFYGPNNRLAAVSYTKVATFSRAGIIPVRETFVQLNVPFVDKPFPAAAARMFQELESAMHPHFEAPAKSS